MFVLIFQKWIQNLPNSLIRFSESTNQSLLKKGQVLIRPNDKIDHVYYIEKGYLKFYSLSDEGKEITYLIYKPGYVFPIGPTFLGVKNKYYFEALTPLIIRKAPRKNFNELVLTNPDFLFSINKEIIGRFGEVLTRMEHLTIGNALKNVSFIILFFANEFTKKNKQSISINLPISHKDIASMAGLARETVSLEMKKLEDMGLISYSRNLITIKNLERFKKETGLYF